MQALLVTGGSGFIGSHLVRNLLTRDKGRYRVLNLDKLTYAGDSANMADLADTEGYTFVRGCITDYELVASLFEQNRFAGVIHLAAESHVDRSITGPLEFVHTNVVGTCVLLECAREAWARWGTRGCFHHVSTDEVYGSLGNEGCFVEETPYSPRSPYSASKAASDHLVRAYGHTYGLNIKVSNCSNNYGPNQHSEKLIPTVLASLLQGKDIPVYGTGRNVRDWLYVGDHVEALRTIFERGSQGSTYNIGGNCELSNIDLVTRICDLFDSERGLEPGESREKISFVQDRLGHDFRYAVDFTRLQRELGWSPRTPIEDGLRSTVAWYMSRPHRLQKKDCSSLGRVSE